MSPLIVLETPGIYGLKPSFQNSLRPMVRLIAGTGIHANQVTIFACVLSVTFGFFLTSSVESHRLFLLLPVVLFVRMALNAADGMLAREFGQSTRIGVYLNELGDVVSDVFLYLPFTRLPGVDGVWLGAGIALAVITELAGTVAAMMGASRRYDGPMGKSDRAVFFGAIALWVGFAGALPSSVTQLLPGVFMALLTLTLVNRVRNGLREGRLPRIETAVTEEMESKHAAV